MLESADTCRFKERLIAMAGFGDIVQKAFYLGVGLAASAGERAGGKLTELRSQAQKLADEMVAKGEMTTDEARRFVDDMMKQAQQAPVEPSSSSTQPGEPRRIEILSEDEEPKPAAPDNDVDAMRQQVQALQDELRRLKRD
jgi:polyhydroxyalkanoate synthesis regulator phasin